MLSSCVLFVLLQVICVRALFVVQTSFVHKSWSSSWTEKAYLMKMVFCICFSCKTPWKVDPQTRPEYPRVEEKKKDITTSKEGHVVVTRGPLVSFFLVFLFFYFSFLFPTSSLVIVATKAAATIANSLNSWLPNRRRQFTIRSRGTHCP